MWHFSLLTLMVALFSPPVIPDPPQAAGALNLQDLLELDVSVAAVRAEHLISTPAVVSRINVADYRHMGFTHLVELLGMVPGLVPIHTEIGTNTLMVRGLSEFFNQKVLFLLDGVPYWQSAHGDHPLLGIPLEAISHLEIIRGPGSVLYGTNATAAVINVVLAKERSTTFQAGLGNHRRRRLGFHQNGDLGPGMWRYQIAAEWHDSAGYEAMFEQREPPPFFPENTPSQGRITRKQGARSILAKFTYDEDLTLLAHAFSSESTGLAGPARVTNRSELQYEGRLLHADKVFYGNKWTLEGYADYNQFYLSIPTANLFEGRYDGVQTFDNSGRDNHRLRLGARFSWFFHQGLALNNGLEYEHREAGLYRNVPTDPGRAAVVTMEPSHQDEQSFFSQLDWHQGPWRVLAGFRHTDLGHAQSQTQPRLAVIHHFSKNLSLKGLYSEGFNSPNFIQTRVNIENVIVGNADLQPEQVKTIDISLNYATPRRMFVANLYRFSGEDFILRTPNPTTLGSVYVNRPAFSRWGCEIDMHHSSEPLLFTANLAYNNAGNRDLSDDPGSLFTPRWTGALGAVLSLKPSTRLGLSWRYVAEQEAAPSHHRLNIAYTRGGRFWEVKIILENVMGQAVYFADIVNLQRHRITPSGDPDAALLVEGRLKLGGKRR
ncbi:TonB-dependent receptor plug domain-containing protein [Acanthopleuribacter pedis]|uniref:TonB-dependent receptor n=1 Tax=Acanthopleuribacter pedis TaxID=442870 RepID=A0A8J7Q951_9BACT|nr:TonB-dependent receptor [Acanthopleuribacter pedis]MBO1319219.1 TonB-dependent receptor [Acanthopleuribacter pedis]